MGLSRNAANNFFLMLTMFQKRDGITPAHVSGWFCQDDTKSFLDFPSKASSFCSFHSALLLSYKIFTLSIFQNQAN